MSEHPLDNPAIVNNLFYPRTAIQGNSRIPNTQDGHIPVDGEIKLGYRLYQPENPRCVVIFFHGNGEVASDYDSLVGEYFRLDCAFLAVDYRGYGWSTGKPRTTTFLTDAESVIPALPDVLGDLNDLPRYIMGRSLGSAPAIHLAHKFPEQFKALIVESGFADMPSVFKRLGIPVDLSTITDLPVGNARTMQEIKLPLLVIHGENDNLLPVHNGQKIYDASPSDDKRIMRIPRVGHNDLMVHGANAYFGAIKKLIDETT